MATKKLRPGATPQDEAPRPASSDAVEAEIDEALVETFPASDPPSWTLGADRPAAPKPGAAAKPDKKRKRPKDAPPRAT
jgi:hypothetical protein